MRFSEFFDRIVVVNLDRRSDRWSQWTTQTANWPFRPADRFRAVDGRAVTPPNWWSQGGGAWGCLMSHARILEDALMDGIDSVLILEDDAVLVPDFSERVEKFLANVPSDWDALYLGGQHLIEPEPVNDEVVRCRDVNRTHGHAMRQVYMREAYAHILDAPAYLENPTHHVDHRLGRLHMEGRFHVYAPTEFLIGQNESRSDINGRHTGARYWNGDRQETQVVADILAFCADRAPASLRTAIDAFAGERKLSVSWLRPPANWFEAGELTVAMRRAKLVVRWGGDRPGDDWIARLSSRHRVPMLTVSASLLPFEFSEGTFVTDCASLWEVGSARTPRVAESDRVRELGERLRCLHQVSWTSPLTPTVVVALVPEHEMPMLAQAAFDGSADLVARVEERHPEAQIVVVAHAEDRHIELPETRSRVVRGSTLLDTARTASLVVGLGSKSLLETALIGIPTQVFERGSAVCGVPVDGPMLERIVAAHVPATVSGVDRAIRAAGVDL
jgi:GR25 family glycosyltransferase involved in LPS biosynthesis